MNYFPLDSLDLKLIFVLTTASPNSETDKMLVNSYDYIKNQGVLDYCFYLVAALTALVKVQIMMVSVPNLLSNLNLNLVCAIRFGRLTENGSFSERIACQNFGVRQCFDSFWFWFHELEVVVELLWLFYPEWTSFSLRWWVWVPPN